MQWTKKKKIKVGTMNNDSDTAGIFRITMCKILVIDGNILQRILRITILSEDMDLILL